MTETTEKIIKCMRYLINEDISSMAIINEDKPVAYLAMNKGEELKMLDLMTNVIVRIGEQCNIQKRFEIYQGLREAANEIMRGEK